MVAKKKIREFFLQSKHHCKTFFFTFRITDFNCWYFCFTLHINLSVCECISIVRVNLFKCYYCLNFWFKKEQKTKRERRTNGIRTSACLAVREPGGSAGLKTALSSKCSSKRQLRRQQVTGLPISWLAGLQGTLLTFFFHSKHKLFPRTMHFGRKSHAAYVQGLRNTAWKRFINCPAMLNLK